MDLAEYLVVTCLKRKIQFRHFNPLCNCTVSPLLITSSIHWLPPRVYCTSVQTAPATRFPRWSGISVPGCCTTPRGFFFCLPRHAHHGASTKSATANPTSAIRLQERRILLVYKRITQVFLLENAHLEFFALMEHRCSIKLLKRLSVVYFI